MESTLDVWAELVKHYTIRDLATITDRLPALGNVAELGSGVEARRQIKGGGSALGIKNSRSLKELN